ncbi:transglutaminase-like domain-containing protein [Deminuibacter soli]|uniref:Transglutaminase-like domain-containing protein n=1 Tax=Deminuibacter soli TaxID=2291815 RepID=A0A3E1NIG5_9BACT|nr:transglutaminase domain-containing protein [Deminuibacter soli]RFM27578.1 hypothetical protein DXN05_12725 [Deminuibacter soli]
MKIGKVHSWKKVFAQVLLLVVPTALLAFYLLWNVNRYYDILQNDWMRQGLYFGAGMLIATVFYGYRFRFITTAALLFAFYFIGYRMVARMQVGEFDAFFVSIRFMVFAILFSLGWITGFGFSRSRYYTVFWSVFLLAAQIIVVSKSPNINAQALISAIVPLLVYAVYIIYAAELIRNMNEDERGFAWFITKRVGGFGVILLLLVLGVFTLFKKDFLAIEKEWGDGKGGNYDKNKGNSESMTKQNRDGSMGNKDQTQLSGSLNKDKRLVFVARLDNFFPDGKTPNPLYFTAYYYTKFDTLTQTFETDSLMPANDLFKPDPSRIPLFFAKTDSTVIKNTHATKNRRVVNAEIYKTLLAANEYIAPSTAFFCQPVPVENAYKDQFKSAYRAKMWVSDLNSAYFIYNPAGNKMLENFQQERFSLLRQVTDWSGVDAAFMKYYTFMPRDAEYDRIATLAKQITQKAGATTAMDKMIALRDYFLSKDSEGQPMFKYSNNPGIPGMPSANKLNYFLFENRKGYCAYYAGATLFMLRSLGIPSRVAAGFLTVDRSSKNPGWYWFYEDQAHAWVQVYFPGYGWIDFDTTIPDLETHEARQPDGTPPLNMQQAYLVADGKVTSVDTVTKKVQMTVEKMLFHDESYDAANNPVPLNVDASIATVTTDTGAVRLSAVKKGMHITAASYAEALKNMKPQGNDNVSSVVKRIPNPTPVDEIKIIEAESEKPTSKKDIFESVEPVDWLRVLWTILIAIAALAVIVLATPWLIWQFLHLRAKAGGSDRARTFRQYRAAMYYLNQLGYYRNQSGPQQYATETDARYSTGFSRFSNVYQKLKYSSLPLSEGEKAIVAQFYRPFIKTVRAKTPFKTRVSKFANIYHTIHYFTQPKIK